MGGFGKKAGAEDGSGYQEGRRPNRGGADTEAGPGDRTPYQEAVPLWGGAWGTTRRRSRKRAGPRV